MDPLHFSSGLHPQAFTAAPYPDAGEGSGKAGGEQPKGKAATKDSGAAPVDGRTKPKQSKSRNGEHPYFLTRRRTGWQAGGRGTVVGTGDEEGEGFCRRHTCPPASFLPILLTIASPVWGGGAWPPPRTGDRAKGTERRIELSSGS